MRVSASVGVCAWAGVGWQQCRRPCRCPLLPRLTSPVSLSLSLSLLNPNPQPLFNPQPLLPKPQHSAVGLENLDQFAVIKCPLTTESLNCLFLSLSLSPQPPLLHPTNSAVGLEKLDQFAVIKCPLTTESAMKKIEDNNTLVFLVDVRADKKKIKKAVQGLYDIQTKKINTLIR